ncbi:MAG: FecR domain-containing protein [Methylovulum sp.]|uniref:TonB-dependent receptor domain-containing protein n=1 Tax=Methylovulum sp. TaxID=1916980 RepID=UPI002604D58C|nr:TonB-dependent receptor [Methylovulum sp.]MDD2722423.1 FecR domain-containing protein [Methylovulum sp.]MDD5124442.1 FecR domain-containing protein [Methylovulum sp.]
MLQKPNYYFIALLLVPYCTQASLPCERPVAQILSAQGKVDALRAQETTWLDVHQLDEFCPGDKIRTAKRSRATLRLSNESIITLEQATTLMFPEPARNAPEWLVSLLNGTSFFRSRQPQQLHINTPFINAVHEGTEFLVRVDDQHTEITVFDGQVAAQNQAGRIQIKPGFVGIAPKHQAPYLQPLMIRPEDAVQWALYYPPLLDYKKLTALHSVSPTFQHGDSYQLLDKLDTVPMVRRDGYYFSLKASLLLNVGRVDEAGQQIDHLLKLNPHDSDALALQSVIATSKNHQDDGLAFAQKAVAINPQSSMAKLALSYAYQALFKLEDALKATQEATRLSSDNALAWARLAELQLSIGNRDDALVSAEKAQSINPALARTQTVLGFAHLAQAQIIAARQAFDQAVALDSSDPLARLGQALTDIRVGKLEQGKQKLETAANLAPNNAIIRSYLGKAHYELKNTEFAETEFKIAKASDPKDPTPWFYDAILKQTNNQPVAALRDMQQAVALNDNRAVYRSRLLLDKDAAVRGTGLGRIYNDLGFSDIASRQASKSLALDPGNYSAHRLLADSAANQPRQETTRSSALLQSQLFQSVNLNPIQPRLAYTDLNIPKSGGPAEIGFNEYNKAFERDNTRITNTTTYGSNNTVGNEAVVSGLINKFAYSLGQLHYDTDGYRANNAIKHDLYNAFAQYEISPKWNVQAEYRRRDTETGDLELIGRADNILIPNYQRKLGQDTYRLGLKFSPAAHSDWVTSFIYANRDEFQDFNNFGFTFGTRDKGYQLESAYVYRQERFNVITGVARYAFEIADTAATNLIFLCPYIACGTVQSVAIQNMGYSYANIKVLDSLTTTLGLSYDNYYETNSSKLNLDRPNPKFGLLWQATNSMTLRLAFFDTVKSPIAVNQVIQPLQVAGFNQFFDDPNGTKATQYGIGMDYRINPNWYAGIEFFKRELAWPYTNFDQQRHFEQRDEDLYRFYINWTINDNWIANSGFRHESFNSGGENSPKAVDTSYLPTSLRFFHPSGFFAEVRGTYVNQQVDRPVNFQEEEFATDFYLVDASIGYRLPKQYGILSLEANNLLDNRFKFRDRTFQINEKRVSDITPVQTLFARFTFNF